MEVKAIAIYHLEAKIISRGEGRSAVAAAAYMSCNKIYNDYDGVQHNYTRKQGLVWEHVFLPHYAPPEWKDRAILWNAVEKSEKSKDSRLAREFVVALPKELDKNQWKELLSEFIQDNFVTDGMCADVAVHDTDGHNPHAHIMLNVRPLDEKGKWQNKTEKEYLCVKDGEERGFTAAEFKAAQSDGWEKQYQYKVGRKKIYMPSSEAIKQGYERTSKYPKSTRYGRQNPIAARWNSEEQLVLWRKAWADINNKYLSMSGVEETIDHRSFADRGIDEQPTVHEGVTARTLEKKGIISERCELNRQIRADNSLLCKLKDMVTKLLLAVRNTIPALANAMENLRQKIVIDCYQLGIIRSGQKDCANYLSAAKAKVEQHNELAEEIDKINMEIQALAAEIKCVPFWNIPKRKKLEVRISEFTEIIEKLNIQKADLINCADISKVKNDIANTKTELDNLNSQEEKYSDKLNTDLQEYSELLRQSAKFDTTELYKARHAIRLKKEQRAEQCLRDTYGNNYDASFMLKCRLKISQLLKEKHEKQVVIKEISKQQSKKKISR